MIKFFNLPIVNERYRGLTCLFRFTVNHTFAFGRWEGQCRWERFLRKLGGFQVRLTVVRTTTTGTVFRLLVLLYYYNGTTLREEGT